MTSAARHNANAAFIETGPHNAGPLNAGVRYAELHCHTNYSFLDGASHPFELVARAAELGYTALGVVDHDGFRGAAKVHQAARHVGMAVVYGTEVGMPPDFVEVPPSPAVAEPVAPLSPP